MAKNIDGASGRRKQAGCDVKQRRLAASSGPDDRDKFAIGHMKCRAFDSRVDAAVCQAECDYDVIECDCCVWCARIVNIGRSHGGDFRHVSSPAYSWQANYPDSGSLQSPLVKVP